MYLALFKEIDASLAYSINNITGWRITQKQSDR